jgi:hypothetical protein
MGKWLEEFMKKCIVTMICFFISLSLFAQQITQPRIYMQNNALEKNSVKNLASEKVTVLSNRPAKKLKAMNDEPFPRLQLSYH